MPKLGTDNLNLVVRTIFISILNLPSTITLCKLHPHCPIGIHYRRREITTELYLPVRKYLCAACTTYPSLKTLPVLS